MLTHFAWCHVDGEWMLEEEDIVESANTHLRKCFVFFTGQKTTHDRLWIFNEIFYETVATDEEMELTSDLNVSDFVIVSVKFPLCPTFCYIIIVGIKELSQNCYGASCCFTNSHNQGL